MLIEAACVALFTNRKKEGCCCICVTCSPVIISLAVCQLYCCMLPLVFKLSVPVKRWICEHGVFYMMKSCTLQGCTELYGLTLQVLHACTRMQLLTVTLIFDPFDTPKPKAYAIG